MTIFSLYTKFPYDRENLDYIFNALRVFYSFTLAHTDICNKYFQFTVFVRLTHTVTMVRNANGRANMTLTPGTG